MSTYLKLRKLVLPLNALLYHAKVRHLERVPKGNGVIFACNHRYWADPFVLIGAVNHDLRFLAKKQLFEAPYGFLLKACGCIPVDQNRKSPSSVSAAIEELQKGRSICIYPEGHRNRSEDALLPFRMGVIRIAKQSGAWIVPTAIRGSYRLFCNDLEIVFGEPLDVGEYGYEEALEILRNRILELYVSEKENPISS